MVGLIHNKNRILGLLLIMWRSLPQFLSAVAVTSFAVVATVNALVLPHAEWICSNSRTAVGLDLDLGALNWCLEKNISRVGADGYSRITLCHGNGLQPLEAKLVNFEPQELISKITLQEGKDGSETCALESTVQVGSITDDNYMKSLPLPPRDIVCAFNYS
ncbi:hypothetical protein SO802_031999 [Lithocarpus litseifolius]|uniref:Uncharacterized protein n=1 Tax=Lithocarpus litseifolius TaxID=425828 RepID=A0AAW2BNW5_9ROSI